MSTAPAPYSRQANFVSYEASNPTTPKRGSDLDGEFNAVRTTLNAALNRLAEIQRDDGLLANASVHPSALTPEVTALMGAGINPRGAWVTATIYSLRDLVTQSGTIYVCVTEHVAGTFSSDLALGRWQALTASAVASATAFAPSGTIAATNVQAAIQELDGDIQTKQPLDATLTAFAALTIGANKIIYGNGPDTFAQSDLTALGRTLLACVAAADMRVVLELIKGTSPGNVVALDGSSRLPAVDGSQLTGVVPANGSVGENQLASTLNLSSKTVILPPSLAAAFTAGYASAEQTISQAGSGTLAHGLGAKPTLVQIVLVCKTAEHDYSINDEVVWSSVAQSTFKGVGVTVDATNLAYRYANTASPFSYVHKTTGASVALTNSSWRMVVRAWK